MPEVFGQLKEITLLGYVLRTLVVGIIVFLVGRFLAKRAINQLTTYDFVLIWILGAITVAPLLDGKVTFTQTITPLLTLFFWHTLLSTISLKSRAFSFFFNGKPLLLIDNGQIVRGNLKKQFINVDLLLSELRVKKVFDVSEVRYCILEPNGRLSILKYDAHNPVTPKDVHLQAMSSDIPLVIINDGKLVADNLEKAGVDKAWLEEKLSADNINDIQEVYVATIDNKKRLYVSRK